jgi:hypothetical protein
MFGILDTSVFYMHNRDNLALLDVMKTVEEISKRGEEPWANEARIKYKNAKKQKGLQHVIADGDVLKSPRFLKGRDVVAIDPEKLAECVLPDWMQAILAQLPQVPEGFTYEPVWFEPKHSRYVFGVCNIKDYMINHLLHFILTDTRFYGLYPELINFHTFEKSDFLTWIQDLNPGKVVQEKHREHFKHSFETKMTVAMNSFLDFLVEPNFKVAVTAWGGHSHFFVKVIPRKGRNLILYLDPNGTQTVAENKKVISALNEVIRLFRPIVDFAPITFHPHVRDQGIEGSCAAVSLLRCLYIVYKTRITPGASELAFINDRIPCIFAIFVSYMFQRANIITKDTTRLARLNEISDAGKHEWIFEHATGTWVRRTESPPLLISLDDEEHKPGPVVRTIPKRKISLRKAVKNVRGTRNKPGPKSFKFLQRKAIEHMRRKK